MPAISDTFQDWQYLGAQNRKINLQRQLHFHQPSHPDFPATEPDDRVNGMVARAVHVAEVNPKKMNPSAVVPGDKKITALDLQGLRCGGDSWTRTNGLTSVGIRSNQRPQPQWS
jgi:hypothetical protein